MTLSEAIATKHEPELPSAEEWLDESIQPRLSSGGWWVAVTNYEDGDIPRWVPRAGPEISMRLLSELLEMGYCVMQVGGGFWIGWPKDAARNGTKRIEDTLANAIAIAYAKAHGIEYEEGG